MWIIRWKWYSTKNMTTLIKVMMLELLSDAIPIRQIKITAWRKQANSWYVVECHVVSPISSLIKTELKHLSICIYCSIIFLTNSNLASILPFFSFFLTSTKLYLNELYSLRYWHKHTMWEKYCFWNKRTPPPLTFRRSEPNRIDHIT